MAYKFIACDFDDTLVTKDKRISQRTKDAVASCAAYGARFVLSTGRTLKSILPYYHELELTTPLITCGGAEVYDKNLNLIYNAPLPADTTHKLLNFAKDLGKHSHIYIGDDFCYAEENDDAKHYAEHTKLRGYVLEDIYERTDLVTPKFLVVSSEEEVARVTSLFSEAFPELNVVRSLGRFLEIAVPKANKGDAVLYTAEYMGYTPDEIIAIGDSEIDISMLNIAALSFCPEGGMPRAKAAADIICKDCSQDCVAEILEEYIFHV